jgi:hypothetical protein
MVRFYRLLLVAAGILAGLGLGGGGDARASTSIEVSYLAVGQADGAPGTQPALSLTLDHSETIKALQTDILFDPTVASFVSAQGVGRGQQMVCSTSEPASGRLRVVLYFDDETTLTAGDGPLASLTFEVEGEAGEKTALTPVDFLLSDANAQALPTVADPGSLRVVSTATPPALDVFALKNPAQPRALQIYVSSDQPLTGVPTVLVGDDTIEMTSLDPLSALYSGAALLDLSSTSATVSVSASNGTANGSAQTTVSVEGGQE